jgi:DNA-binding XRE family transcriptional regulator
MSRRTRLTRTVVKRPKRVVTYITVEREVTSAGPVYVAFGKVIRTLRTRLGLTQEGVGKAVALSRTSVVNIECSRQSVALSDVFAFARALDVKPEKLVALVAAEMEN